MHGGRGIGTSVAAVAVAALLALAGLLAVGGPAAEAAPRLTPAAATSALRAALGHRYGDYRGATRRYVACPRTQLAGTGSRATAFCQFQYARRGKARGGDATVAIVTGRIRVVRLQSTTFAKALRACRVPAAGRAGGRSVTARSLRAGGFFRPCAALVGDGGLGAQLEAAAASGRLGARRTLTLPGPSLAPFAELARFPCRVTRRGARRTADCRNALGDRFTYGFTIR